MLFQIANGIVVRVVRQRSPRTRLPGTGCPIQSRRVLCSCAALRHHAGAPPVKVDKPSGTGSLGTFRVHGLMAMVADYREFPDMQAKLEAFSWRLGLELYAAM